MTAIKFRIYADGVLVAVYETYEEALEELTKRSVYNPEFIYEIRTDE